MTAIIGEIEQSADVRSHPETVPSHGGIRVSGVPLGASSLVAAGLTAALDGDPRGCVTEADGLLVAFDSWVDDVPPRWLIDAFLGLSDGELTGRPVGLIGAGADARRVSENLAWFRSAVRDQGGYPVGAGFWLCPADWSRHQVGAASLDVTVAVNLAQFGRRVRSLAWARRVLRAA